MDSVLPLILRCPSCLGRQSEGARNLDATVMGDWIAADGSVVFARRT
jgi:hypothetical protein